MIKVGIVGGTGYTGVELLRLLAVHPQVQLTAITSRKEDGLPVADMYPSLRGRVNLAFSAPDKADLTQCDVVFFATPHGVAMAQADYAVMLGEMAAETAMALAEDVARNRRFANLFEIWLEGDHYKWRAMRAHGVPERFCTGDAAPGAHLFVGLRRGVTKDAFAATLSSSHSPAKKCDLADPRPPHAPL